MSSPRAAVASSSCHRKLLRTWPMTNDVASFLSEIWVCLSPSPLPQMGLLYNSQDILYEATSTHSITATTWRSFAPSGMTKWMSRAAEHIAAIHCCIVCVCGTENSAPNFPSFLPLSPASPGPRRHASRPRCSRPNVYPPPSTSGTTQARSQLSNSFSFTTEIPCAHVCVSLLSSSSIHIANRYENFDGPYSENIVSFFQDARHVQVL